jgi:hypothetical protein
MRVRPSPAVQNASALAQHMGIAMTETAPPPAMEHEDLLVSYAHSPWGQPKNVSGR